MSRATQATILRHGRLALAAPARKPLSSAALAKKLKVDLRVAQRLIRDLRGAGYSIRARNDGRRLYYSIGEGCGNHKTALGSLR
jgi:DNA-binding MarR family transcriptional regulator